MSVGNRVNQAAELEIYRVNQPFSGAKIRPGYKVVTGGLRANITSLISIIAGAGAVDVSAIFHVNYVEVEEAEGVEEREGVRKTRRAYIGSAFGSTWNSIRRSANLRVASMYNVFAG